MSLETSRNRLKPPPSKLVPILELVNLAPPEFDFPDLAAVVDKVLKPGRRFESRSKARRGVNSIASEKTDEALVKAVNSFVRRLPGRLREYLLHIASHPEKWGFPFPAEHASLGAVLAVINSYHQISESRDKLRTILKGVAESESGAWLRFKDETIITIDASLFVDDRGIVRLAKDQLTEAIEGVEVARIRECAICRHLFWAGRNDALCCSTACHNAHRNRRYRARREQGYYQGARLTKKEKARTKRQKEKD
jgi:hypothetical protein